VKHITAIMPSRNRFSGSPSELRDALLPHATCPAWFKYAESDKSTVNSQMLLKYGGIMRTLHSLQANLSFNKTTMQSAMEGILEKKNGEWLLDEAEQKSQPEVLCKRLRAACRHAGQALGRKDAPAWVREIFGDDGKEVKEVKEEKKHKVSKKDVTKIGKAKTEKGKAKKCKRGMEATSPRSSVPGAAVAAEPVEHVFFGWDAEFGKAWRAATSDRSSVDFAVDMVEPENATASMPMLAKFKDGTTHPIEEMMVGDWRARGGARAVVPSRPTKSDIWFETTYPPTQQPLVVKSRKDRLELMAIFLGKSQKLQVPLHAFKSSKDAAKFAEAMCGSFVNPNEVTG
jgi:hypothetical protein